MRVVSLLLLLALATVFFGLAPLYARNSHVAAQACCGGGEHQEEGSDPSPCNPAECPCAFCFPIVLGEAVALDYPLDVLSSVPFAAPLRHLSAFHERIEYPPETA